MKTNGNSITPPSIDSYPEWYRNYAELATEGSISDALNASRKFRKQVLKGLHEEKYTYRYAEGKWSVQEIMLHMIDSERVFLYRALSFARGEEGSLPGYDHEAYAVNSDADARSYKSLLKEVKAVRKATIAFFNGLSSEQLMATGLANGQEMSVAQLGFIIAGHERHHLKVLSERYI